MNFDEAISGFSDDATPPADFEPYAWYNAVGDTLEVFLVPGVRIAERVDAMFTVFTSATDRSRVVGVAIKNIAHHFGQSGLKSVYLQAGRARLAALVASANFVHRVSLTKVSQSADEVLQARGSELLQSLAKELGDVEIELPEELLSADENA